MGDYRFLPYDPEKPLLLPPDMRRWLPEDHLALFISDLFDSLDLGEIVDKYLHLEGGHPAYHPAMMLKLIFYGYCVGIRSSRRVEQKTYEDVAFRVLSCDTHPDHSRIADFRKRHLKEISRLFVQVLEICKASGLVKLGHVALDGTKIKANASKHKAMNYDRMKKREPELAAEVDRLLAEAAALDEQAHKKYGKGKRGDELPKELRFKQARLANIRQAKQALEEQARQQAIKAGKLAPVTAILCPVVKRDPSPLWVFQRTRRSEILPILRVASCLTVRPRHSFRGTTARPQWIVSLR